MKYILSVAILAISLIVPAQAQVRASVAPAVMAECAAQQTLTPFCQVILQQMQGDPTIAGEQYAIIPVGRYQPPIVVGSNTRYGTERKDTFVVTNSNGRVTTRDGYTEVTRTPYNGVSGQVGYASQSYNYVPPQQPYYGQQPGGGGIIGVLDRTLNGVNGVLGQYERAAGSVANAGHRIEGWEANKEATRQRRTETKRRQIENARRQAALCEQYPEAAGC